ncbi:MAG: PAS domain S-box protein [Candidatus Erginobacter occultus]|nr:PAS domain S-box protein [Candidatus Erginobacter occultus]
MDECVLLITRAAVLAVAAAYLWRVGRRYSLRRQGGWSFIVSGFSLLLFGLLWEILAYFSPPGGSFLGIPAGVEFFFKDITGYLLGIILMAIGFLKWIPAVLTLADSRRRLEHNGAALEAAVAERTARLEELNLRLERELAERREMDKELGKFRAIADLAPYGVGIIDLDQQLVYVNRALAEMHGCPVKDLLGKDVSALHSPEQMDRVRKAIDKLRREGTAALNEILHLRRDGTVFPTLMAGSVIRGRDGEPAFLAATMIDISDRKERERELLRLSGALAGLAEMVIITDIAHRIIYANPAAEKILGYHPSEMAGRDSRDFFEGISGNPERLAEKMAVEAVGGTWEGELLNRRKDGRIIDVHLTMTVLRDGNGEKTGYVGITRDITERKQTEVNLAKAYRQLRDIKAQLIQAEKLSSLGLLAAGVAHELNSPLDGLMTMLRLSRKQADPESPEDERAAAMLAAAEHMARIVGDLTAFARRSEGDLQELDLNEVIDSTLSFSACQLAGREITVARDFARGLKKVRGDRGQLQQVILNLVTNARDAMTEGGRLEIKTENSPDRAAVELTVSDNGSGIAPENLERLFDPFFTTKGPGEGIGLGLSVAYGIIEGHGGEISVESEPGRGTVFTIRLTADRDGNNGKTQDIIS